MLSQANKLRAIDDGRLSGHNKSCFSEETINTTNPDFVAAACKVCLEYLRGHFWHGGYESGLSSADE